MIRRIVRGALDTLAVLVIVAAVLGAETMPPWFWPVFAGALLALAYFARRLQIKERTCG